MTFDDFVLALDARLKADAPAGFGLFQGPHVAYWQCGAETARVREGQRGDVELTLAGDEADELDYGRCDDVTAGRFARAIAGRFAAV